MNKTISEQALETAIIADLAKAHYMHRPPTAFDKALCLDPGPLIDFIEATQPKEWAKFVVQHKDEAKPAFLKRVAEAIEADGTVTVLRQGVKAIGLQIPARVLEARDHVQSRQGDAVPGESVHCHAAGALQREDLSTASIWCCC